MESAIRPESEGPLLSLSFQKDPEQKKKFLDSQPKALGMKACLVMEIISSICTGLGFFIFFAYQFILRIVVSDFNFCWRFENSTQPELRICRQFFELSMFFHNEQCLMLALNFTLGVTICSYCCKAIRCCGPASSMPVIVLNAPSAPLSGPSRGADAPQGIPTEEP